MKKRVSLRFILHPSALILISLLAGCWKDDMADGSHYKPYEASPQFQNAQLARPLVNGTVPRGGQVVSDTIYAVTALPTTETTSFPSPLTAADLARGRERFNIYCMPCHGATGDGNGMIVQRGFPHPPSFYLDRLRDAPPGHFYNVITHGYGAMYSYNDRVTPDDRWRIAAYIRALQLSAPNKTGIPETPPAQRK
jgi:mono/diheme cytochrome c family protein